MLIKRVSAPVIRLPIANGVTIQEGDAVGVSSGEAVLADKDQQISVVGLAKSIQSGTIYVQTEGKFSSTTNGDEFWLGNNGSLLSTPPNSGMLQKIANRVDSQYILISIDQTVIIL